MVQKPKIFTLYYKRTLFVDNLRSLSFNNKENVFGRARETEEKRHKCYILYSKRYIVFEVRLNITMRIAYVHYVATK